MTASAKEFRLTQRDFEVAEWIGDRGLATAEQVHRARLYPALQKAQSRLHKLFKAGVLNRFALPIVLNNGGKPRFVYHEGKKPGLGKVAHALAINDLRIAFEVACRDSSDVRVVDFIPDCDWKRRLNEVLDSRMGRGVNVPRGIGEEDGFQEGEGGRDSESGWEGASFLLGGEGSWAGVGAIIPDGVMCLENRKTGVRALFFCEVDLGTEKLMAEERGHYSVLQKMLLYKELADKSDLWPFKQLFNAEFRGFRVLVVMSRPGRMLRLRRELRRSGATRLIWLTEQARIQPGSVWDAIWMLPDEQTKERVSLLRD